MSESKQTTSNQKQGTLWIAEAIEKNFGFEIDSNSDHAIEMPASRISNAVNSKKKNSQKSKLLDSSRSTISDHFRVVKNPQAVKSVQSKEQISTRISSQSSKAHNIFNTSLSSIENSIFNSTLLSHRERNASMIAEQDSWNISNNFGFNEDSISLLPIETSKISSEDQQIEKVKSNAKKIIPQISKPSITKYFRSVKYSSAINATIKEAASIEKRTNLATNEGKKIQRKFSVHNQNEDCLETNTTTEGHRISEIQSPKVSQIPIVEVVDSNIDKDYLPLFESTCKQYDKKKKRGRKCKYDSNLPNEEGEAKRAKLAKKCEKPKGIAVAKYEEELEEFAANKNEEFAEIGKYELIIEELTVPDWRTKYQNQLEEFHAILREEYQKYKEKIAKGAQGLDQQKK